MARQTIEEKKESIKNNIKDWNQYFRTNFVRFNFFKRFVFETTLSPQFISLLQELGRPQMEFNIVEAYLNQQLGQFVKQEPSFNVSQSDTPPFADPQLIKTIDAYLRHVLFESTRDNLPYDVYGDMLAGGFSVIKVFVDYTNEMSLDQSIFIKKVFDPTLTIFDKYARESHKGDGAYSGELYPMPREEFEDQFGKGKTNKMKFKRNVSATGNSFDFTWSFINSTLNREVVLVGDYYEKNYKKEKILKVQGQGTMTESDYERLVLMYMSNPHILEQIPTVIGKPRVTEIPYIDHYHICESEILHKESTNLKYLPHVFADGNSKFMRNETDGSSYQLTKPLIYNAKGIQDLKNLSGVMLANDLENMMQTKIMAAKEAIPAEYLDAYLDPQTPSVLVYNAFKDNDPNSPLPPPSILPRVPTPPEVTQAFSMSDTMTQTILGTYDGALATNKQNVSGIAIENGAMHTGASTQPWNVGYLKMMNRVAEIVLDLIPKTHMDREVLPGRQINGTAENMPVNQPGTPSMDFNPMSMQVKVEAGANYELQQRQAFEGLTTLMKVCPTLNQLIGETPEGVEMILSNTPIKGIDALKQAVPQFMQKQAQQKQQQMQMGMQMNPAVIKMKEIQQKAQSNQQEFQLGVGKLNLEKEKQDTDHLLAMANLGIAVDNQEVAKSKVDAENSRTAVDAITKLAAHDHSVVMDKLNHHQKNEHHSSKLEHEMSKNGYR